MNCGVDVPRKYRKKHENLKKIQKMIIVYHGVQQTTKAPKTDLNNNIIRLFKRKTNLNVRLNIAPIILLKAFFI